MTCWQPSTQWSFRQLSSVIGPCCNLNIVNCILNRPKLTFQMERHIAGLNRHLLLNRPKSLLNLTKVLNSGARARARGTCQKYIPPFEQPDHIHTVLLWYLVKSVRYCIVAYTEQVTLFILLSCYQRLLLGIQTIFPGSGSYILKLLSTKYNYNYLSKC